MLFLFFWSFLFDILCQVDVDRSGRDWAFGAFLFVFLLGNLLFGSFQAIQDVLLIFVIDLGSLAQLFSPI